METTTHQPGSLVTIKSVAGSIWLARYVRHGLAEPTVICQRADGSRFEINVERIVSIGEPHHASW